MIGPLRNSDGRKVVAGVPAEIVVSIHPHKAAVLAQALQSTGAALDRLGHSVHGMLVEAHEDGTAAVGLLDASAWFASQASLLGHMLDEIGSWQSGAGPRPMGIDVNLAPYDAAFDDPRAADQAGQRAVTLLSDDAANEPDELIRLLVRWQANPVFAARVTAAFDAERVVGLAVDWTTIDSGLSNPANAGADGSASLVSRRDALSALFATFATTSRFGPLPFHFGELVSLVDTGQGEDDAKFAPRVNRGRNPLGALFVPGAVWAEQFLLDAMNQLVLPANRQTAERHVVHLIGGFDPRAAVLSAVARDPAVAARILTETDLDQLLAERLAYEDGGRALGALLVSGTATSAEAMTRVVNWVAEHRELPPLARARLVDVAVPYLAAFRNPVYDDDATLAQPLAPVSDDNRLGFLSFIVVGEKASADLRAAELQWMANTFRQMAGAGFDGRGIAAVADVDQRVAEAVITGEHDRMLVADKAPTPYRDLSNRALTVLSAAFPVLYGLPASLVGSGVIDNVLADGDSADRYLRDAARNVRHANTARSRLALLGALWSRRDENHVFDSLPPVPALLMEGGVPIWASGRIDLTRELTPEQGGALARWLNDRAVIDQTHWKETATADS
jgi:hypothetical protein